MKRILPLLLLLLLPACDTYEQDDYEPEYVVEAYLVAGEPLPPVKLSRTAPFDAAYSFAAFAVDGAAVAVHLLDEAGGIAETYAYAQLPSGAYGPAAPAPVVEPLRRYRLDVRVGSDVVRSETLVPGAFSLLGVNADTLFYQSTEQLEAHVTPSEYPGRQTIYAFTLLALDTVYYDLTPFYADFVDNDDSDLTRADLVENPSGIVNAANFDRNPDGTVLLRLPWIAVAFYGPNDVIANAIDDNLYNFLRSQIDTGTTSPGEIANLLDDVEGGRGVFGSMSRARLRVVVLPAGS